MSKTPQHKKVGVVDRDGALSQPHHGARRSPVDQPPLLPCDLRRGRPQLAHGEQWSPAQGRVGLCSLLPPVAQVKVIYWNKTGRPGQGQESDMNPVGQGLAGF